MLKLPLVLISTVIVITRTHSITDANEPTRVLQKFFGQCTQKEELIKCFKIQALKVAERALRIHNFNVVDGLSIVTNGGRSVGGLILNDSKLERLSHEDLDGLLEDRTSRFLDTHRLEVNVPKLIEESGRALTEEGRKRKGGGKKGGNNGALLAALAIKGSFLALAYKGIAVMSATALLVGKMALILSAILGLKKLVSGNNEKTTFEIIKSPKYTEEHIHSSVHEDDHDGYRRNYHDTGEIQKRIYRFQIPDQ